MNETIAKVISSIKQANPLMYVASGAEDFVKVWAEYKYDALAKTSYFKKLRSLEKKEKLVIVATMFALNAHLKINTNENTPLNLFWKGIITDFFPEMGKRLLNGNASPDPDEQEVIELIRKSDANDGTHYAPRNEQKKETSESVFSKAEKDIEEGLDFFAKEMTRRREIRKGGT
jgi:hypothetical protein